MWNDDLLAGGDFNEAVSRRRRVHDALTHAGQFTS